LSGVSDLTLDKVVIRYGDTTVLHQIDLEVRQGELIALLGSSGCGKTSLLRAVAGFVPLASGRIRVGAADITNLPAEKRNCAMMFQSYALWPHMSVAQNIGYGLRVRGWSRERIDARVGEMLKLLQLDGYGSRGVDQLSGGQRQRVAMGRALAIDPALLLLDEPMSNLDYRIRLELRHEIRALQQRLGITTILVTHDQEEALTMADRIAVMKDGAIEQVGSPEQVYLHPATPFVADFVGRTNLLAASRAGEREIQVGEQRLACAAGAPLAANGSLRVFFRPEDVCVRGVDPGTPNALAATVEKIEFLGAYSRLTMRLAGIEQPLVADLSPHDMAEVRPRPGDSLRVALPPERLRVFEIA